MLVEPLELVVVVVEVHPVTVSVTPLELVVVKVETEDGLELLKKGSLEVMV